MRAVFVMLGALAATLIAVVAYGLHLYTVSGPLAATHSVLVPRGSLETVADTLVAEHVVDSAATFRLAALLTSRRGPLHSAELEFPAQASLSQVLSILRTAKPVQRKLTVPEGLTALQIAALLDRTPGLEGLTATPAEGRFLPETYIYELGTLKSVVVERGRAAMERALDRAWAARTPGLPLGTRQDALVLASIVERETGKPDERPRVAAVFLNRLKRGMKLQSDPTIIYAVSGGLGVLDHGITKIELERDDPYNTYKIPGLPPGPIAMPGAASLKAVTQPLASDDLFFVADGTGGHVFARTQDEHLKNVAHWREVERARIKSASP